MAKVARSSTAKSNNNKLRVHKVKVYFQLYPGKVGNDTERAIATDVEYELYLNDRFSQSGTLQADGSAELLIPAGYKAELKALGTSYELEPRTRLAPHNSPFGAQQRLRLLGYYPQEPDGTWDATFDRAILNFQADNGLDPNGQLQDATYDRIQTVFGE